MLSAKAVKRLLNESLSFERDVKFCTLLDSVIFLCLSVVNVITLLLKAYKHLLENCVLIGCPGQDSGI